ncbi:Inner membrane protein YtfF [Chlamydia avium]|uniref:EamA-like transporter family protein n=1 Tax=Chlamydia avium TaxID=1457141 RepID=A0ABN0MSM6_9CHLA|nr:DMT family transporter [Chlamydia avium]EPP37357.1 eamA-like transporter family protein [Chlamydia psittaci 10_743_SC13]EPP38427.1 eamA-like transporter family protein [Chlamydia avium]VVT42888.1 Inner membrane protein YtfF [Chlamydia avium]
MLLNKIQIKQSRNVPFGVFHSLLACLYWGIVFVIPDLLHSFQEIDIVLARYTIFGMFSLLSILWRRQNIFRNVPLIIWKQGIFWAFIVNVVYYLGIAYATRCVGAAVTIIISGLAPIIVLFHSNIKKKEISYTTLSLLSSIIFLGILLTNISKIHTNVEVHLAKYFLGLVCVIISTGIWVSYIIYNYTFLSKNPQISPNLWCCILGLASLALCIPFIILGDCLGITQITSILISHTPLSEKLLFIILCGAMGIFSSSLAITSWNKASLHLSPSLLGALLILEPIFGLCLSYFCKHTLPSWQEGLGILLMLGGSLACLILFGKKAHQDQKDSTEVISSTD